MVVFCNRGLDLPGPREVFVDACKQVRRSWAPHAADELAFISTREIDNTYMCIYIYIPGALKGDRKVVIPEDCGNSGLSVGILTPVLKYPFGLIPGNVYIIYMGISCVLRIQCTCMHSFQERLVIEHGRHVRSSRSTCTVAHINKPIW